MAELTKIFTGMKKGPEEIDKNFTALSRLHTASLLTSDVISTENISDMNLFLNRIGNMVYLSGKINVSKVTKPSFEAATIPGGFSVSNSMTQDSFRNLSLSIAKGGDIESNSCRALLLDGGKLELSVSTTGNHYITGSWLTDDDFPTE